MPARTRVLLLSDNVGTEYVSRIERGASKAALGLNVELVAVNLHGTGKTIPEALDQTAPAGVIVTPPISDDRHWLTHIEQRRLPCIRIAPMLDPDRGGTVTMDEFDAARAVVDHMLERGHRRVGFLRGPRTHLVSMRRYNGYTAALGGKGLRVDPELIAEGDFSRESGRALAGKLFAAKPTAIFASNDEMAVGIIEAADRAGIRIPGDISLVGFDDNAVAKSVRPRLTSVRQPLEEMGETACQMLVARLNNPARGNEHRQVPYEIMVRDSVADFDPAPAD